MIDIKRENKKIRKFDYNQKKLENPFFKKKEKIGGKIALKTKIFIIVFIFFFCSLFWFFYFSNFLNITKISIEGLSRVSSETIYKLTEDQINKKMFFIFPQKNLPLFDSKKFSNYLIAQYRFDEVIINKKMPHDLTIIIKEKPFACIWNENEKYYYADSDGFVLEEINPLDIKNKKYPLILNYSAEKITNYKIGTNKEFVDIAIQLFNKLSDKSFDINIAKFIIDKDMDTIKIETEEGVKISFSTKGDLDKQIEKLITIKREKLKDDFNEKKYIDLRFGDKVYYQ